MPAAMICIFCEVIDFEVSFIFDLLLKYALIIYNKIQMFEKLDLRLLFGI